MFRGADGGQFHVERAEAEMRFSNLFCHSVSMLVIQEFRAEYVQGYDIDKWWLRRLRLW